MTGAGPHAAPAESRSRTLHAAPRPGPEIAEASIADGAFAAPGDPMICATATTKPRPGRERELDLAASEHAAALRRQPGCLGAYVMHDRAAGSQVSLSIFATAEDLDRALVATRPIIARHPLDDLREGGTDFRLLEVVDPAREGSPGTEVVAPVDE